MQPKAFTLIELLVVVTIIVVLLALLVPAMDKAIYQAELAVCGANMHGALAGLTTYAVDHKRHYPHRTLVLDQPIIIKSGVKGTGTAFEDRRPLIGYVKLNAWSDPLVEPVRMEIGEVHPDSWVFVPLTMWYDFQFSGFSRMSKVGQRFSWREVQADGTHRIIKFDLLLSDKDGFGEWHASHPDSDGRMVNFHMQDENNELEQTYRDTGGATALSQIVASFWRSESGGRGTLDLNFLHEDGSVRRMNRVTMWDDRMERVPNRGDLGGWIDGQQTGVGIQLPRN